MRGRDPDRACSALRAGPLRGRPVALQFGPAVRHEDLEATPAAEGSEIPSGSREARADGRFLGLGRDENPGGLQLLVDTSTEKASPGAAYWTYLPSKGWTGEGTVDHRPVVYRLPPRDHLNIPPDLLELWAQVLVRGHLDDEGAFVTWNEPNWEKKRQELAAKPAPIADFPFPGHVASDRLHWLRQEFENAGNAEKPRLAKQLLDRAEAMGDQAEVIRWRTLLRESAPKEPPASK